MKLKEILEKIQAPKGLTTVIAALHTGDLKPAFSSKADVNTSLKDARNELEKVLAAQEVCGSDWAWWGYEGDKAYWRCLIYLLEAAEITGPDNLPEVKLPPLDGIVMDNCSEIERFGKAVLSKARVQTCKESLDELKKGLSELSKGI